MEYMYIQRGSQSNTFLPLVGHKYHTRRLCHFIYRTTFAANVVKYNLRPSLSSGRFPQLVRKNNPCFSTYCWTCRGIIPLQFKGDYQYLSLVAGPRGSVDGMAVDNCRRIEVASLCARKSFRRNRKVTSLATRRWSGSWLGGISHHPRRRRNWATAGDGQHVPGRFPGPVVVDVTYQVFHTREQMSQPLQSVVHEEKREAYC